MNTQFPTKTSEIKEKFNKSNQEYQKKITLLQNELQNIKNENKQNILDNHCYTNRVKTLLEL